jgi:endonuclease YncB( thermonuclease family)
VIAVSGWLIAALLVNQAVQTRFVAKVVGVADSDTITVLRDRQQSRIRLDGIDCPEEGQAFGTRAKRFTWSLVFGRRWEELSRGTSTDMAGPWRAFTSSGTMSAWRS